MFWGLLLTLITGLSFLVGIILLNKSKNKEDIAMFTTSLAFVIILGLLIFDLLPEIIEYKNFLLIIPFIIGFSLLILLDKLIPHHHHNHQENNDNKKEHIEHLNHIGIITILALTIHNLLEGLTLYSVTINNLISGILMMISISLHNIPLGFQIGNDLRKEKNNIFLILLLVFSSFLGSLIVIIFGNLNTLIESMLLSLTFGMLLYILIFELFNEFRLSFKKKSSIYGIILGVIVLLITLII